MNLRWPTLTIPTNSETLLNGGLAVLLVLILLGSAIGLFLSTPVAVDSQNPVVTIPRGSSLNTIAQLLEKERIISDRKAFVLATQLMMHSKSLQAGRFDLTGVRNYWQLIRKLSQARPFTIRVTIPEGYQSRQIVRILAEKLPVSETELTTLIHDETFCRSLGVNGQSLEGYLFPETYNFTDSESAASILAKIVGHFFIRINDSLRAAITASGRDLHKILTLASIVEGECRFDDERPLVASVYLNRLKQGIRLESDPTIQYIIPDGPRRLLLRDLEIESPYNTYRHFGLPPGPINNPGYQSILAAIYPARTNYLYMVAIGDGRHEFTQTHHEFLKAKKRFQQVRRKVAYQARTGKTQ